MLIRLLVRSGMEEDEMLATVLCLESMEAKIQMIKWIASKKNPTSQEILHHLIEMIRAAKGEYICFLDSDDFWRPDTAERLCSVAEEFALQAVVFSAVYSISMNLIGWTVASAIIANDKKYIKVKNFILNPAVIALFVALPLFFKNIYIGDTQFGEAVFLLGRMTTPMCMLIMGMRLASVSLKPVLTRKLNYLVVFLKQIVMPLVGLAVISFLPIDPNMKRTFYIICCCPIASVVLNFSEMLGEGQEMAANLVLLGTFSSILTLPLMSLLST